MASARAVARPHPATSSGASAADDDPDRLLAAVTAALDAGHEKDALDAARRILAPDHREPAVAVRLAAALDRATALGPALLAARARARWHAGRLTDAHADALASLGSRDLPATRAILRSIEGELTSLEPGWLPAVDVVAGDHPSAGAHPSAVPARPPSEPDLEARRPRLLHLVSGSRPWLEGGFAIRTHDVALAQRAAGLDAQVATPPGFPGRLGVPGAPLESVLEGVPYHRLGPDDRHAGPADERITRTAAAFRELVERFAPDVIAAAETASLVETTAQAALAVGRHAGIPVVLEVRGLRDEAWSLRADTSAEPERLARVRASDAATWAAADAVVTLGAGLRDALVARGVPGDRIVLVPNAVDAERFQPGPRDPALAARLGIAPDEVVLGHAGRLSAYEGLDLLLDATRVLLERGRRVRLIIVGDGEAAADLRARAGALGLGGAALLPGHVPHETVVDHLRLIDCFVVPRPDHALTRIVTPIKPVEALAAGCTVVVSDLPALRELVTDGVTGRTFAAGDLDALVTVLDELVADPDARARLAAAGSRWARTERTWAANGARYRSLVDRLLGG
jgi:glycosyltransferase involved in cell wall biosynthesis